MATSEVMHIKMFSLLLPVMQYITIHKLSINTAIIITLQPPIRGDSLYS